MIVVREKISVKELKKMSEKMFGDLVKAVVDIEKGIMVVDAGMHCDEEELLLDEEESVQKNLWGINLYPDKFGDPSWIVFDSMINLRPLIGNRTCSVDSPQIQAQIRKAINKLIVA
jgi:hypothetical protein